MSTDVTLIEISLNNKHIARECHVRKRFKTVQCVLAYEDMLLVHPSKSECALSTYDYPFHYYKGNY